MSQPSQARPLAPRREEGAAQRWPASRPSTGVRMLRLFENMTLGRNAVGYLTESMHGAGSPPAQRIQIQRAMDLDRKKGYARSLASIPEKDG
jgi:aromatic ring hydroxylase